MTGLFGFSFFVLFSILCVCVCVCVCVCLAAILLCFYHIICASTLYVHVCLYHNDADLYMINSSIGIDTCILGVGIGICSCKNMCYHFLFYLTFSVNFLYWFLYVNFYFSSRSLHKLMRFWVIQRSVRFMINMVKMPSKKEWVEEEPM